MSITSNYNQSGRILVGLSIYKSDIVEWVKESIDSLLAQTYSNFHLVIAVDGPVSQAILDYLHVVNIDHENITIEVHEENKGLALRMNQIIEKYILVDQLTSFEYFARMDADDVCDINRFLKQVEFFESNRDIALIGTDIIEIDEVGRELFHKRMSSNPDDILNDIIKKCPVNHPSVMMRVSALIEHNLKYNGTLMNTQDYYLWVDFLNKGLKISNVNEPLLRFRVSNNFHSRRGFKKSVNEFKSRLYAFRKIKCYSFSNFAHVVLLFTLRLAPSFIKKFAYNNFR